MTRPTVLLYNPVSTSKGKQRLPLSLLAISAVITNDYDIQFVDGNLVDDPATQIIERAKATGAKLLAVTTMPGPQIRQAVPVCKQIKTALPDLQIVWGGYFPTQHRDVILQSGFVDYVILGQGEAPFRKLVDVVHYGGSLDDVPSLGYCKNGAPYYTPRGPSLSLNNFPTYPYDKIDVSKYVGRSYLGTRVLNHNTSFGCVFNCSFCAVVELSKRRWLPESAERVANIVTRLQDEWHINALEFHDMDFFISEDRTAEFAERIADKGLHWWALGRVDTLVAYSDDTWDKMKASGAKMLFMGAESGSDETLKLMNKGGHASTNATLAIVERMKHYGVIPELSFVLGNPPDPAADIESTIQFIRKLKAINPATELVLYIYTPVIQEGSIMLEEATKLGFRFPETLEDWASPHWAKFAMRRDPGTPWFRDKVRSRVRNFETVINAYYPTITDVRLQGQWRRLLEVLSGWRYRFEFYDAPYELKALQRLIHYRRPETTGF